MADSILNVRKYRLNDESNDEIKGSSSSSSIVSQCPNKNSLPSPTSYLNFNTNSNLNDLRGRNILERKEQASISEKPFNHSKYRRNDNFNLRQGTLNTKIPTRLIEYNKPVVVVVTYQRFQSGVDFEGELSKYYNPTLYYNSISFNESYFPQSGDFCVVKSLNDSNWYRARVIRLVGNEKAQLIYIETGEMSEINVNLIQPLNQNFRDRPAQALACTLAQVLPFTQNERYGLNGRACMSLENTLMNERISTGKLLFKVTFDENHQGKWPMMFIQISTPTVSSLSEHMCQLYLSRRASNLEISEYWSRKIRPEQYVLFNLSSLINQKQYFSFDHVNQSTLSFDLTIDIIIADPEFLSRQ